MPASSRFWDRIADKYAAQPVANEKAYEHKLEETRKRLAPDMTLLEFGCGTGTTALIHAPRVAAIRAIDISPRMIEICRNKAADKGIDNVTFETGTLEALEAADESFDAVLGMSILHLLPDRHAAIAKVARLLKPGGWFFSSTACVRELNPLLGLAMPVMRFVGLAPYVAVFSTDDLVRDLEAAGFAIDLTWRAGPTDAIFVIARKP